MKSYLLAAVAAFCVLLPACKGDTDSARLIVTYATMKVIEQGDTAEHQAVRAERIRGIATDVQGLLEGESTTIALLEAAVREKLVALSLSPADTFLANELLGMVMAELQERVGTGVLDPEKRVKVAAVIGWVVDATALVSPPA